MRFGAHVSVAGGYAAAVDYALEVGCECMQVFAKSPRQWNAKPIDLEAAAAFRARVAETGMGPVLTHTAYLINLGSAEDGLWERSILALADELVRGAALGAAGVVTHLGTEFKTDPARTPERMAEAIDRAWTLAGAPATRLLLENTAAAGSTFGDGADEIGAVLALLGDAAGSVGVCLDTCHAHAAGWDLSGADGWNELLGAFESCCGMPIEAIHANDCAFGAGMHKDRHAWIGDGTIGYEGFALMVAEPRLAGLTVITEMPGDIPVKDAENLSRLKRLRESASAGA